MATTDTPARSVAPAPAVVAAQAGPATPPATHAPAGPVADAIRRYARTGDDSELVALGVLPPGKPLTYEPE